MPDKLTEAISRLNEAEMQLGHLVSKMNANGSVGMGSLPQNLPGSGIRDLLKEIQTEVRRARMRIEEFKDSSGTAEARP